MTLMPVQHHLNRVACVVMGLLLAAIAFYAVPRLGFDFTDHGYYLYNASLLSQGVVPTAGFAGAINGLFRWLGFQGYLFFELLYFSLVVASVWSLWLCLNATKLWPVLLFISLISLSSKFTYILSYQNGPEIYLLFALSLFWLGQHIKPNKKALIILFLSAALLALSSLANISLLPAVVSNTILILCFNKQSRKLCFFMGTYLLISAVLFYAYQASSLSWFKQNSAQGDLSHIIGKIPDLYWYLFVSNGVYCFVLLFSVAIKLYLYWRKARGTTLRLAGFLLALSLLLLYQIGSMHTLSPIYKTISTGVLWLRVLPLSMILFLDGTSEKKKFLTMAGLMVLSYASALALTTHGDFGSHIGLLSSAASVITALLFVLTCQDSDRLAPRPVCFMTIFIVLLGLSAGLSGYRFVHYSYRAWPIVESKPAIRTGRLSGIHAAPNKYKAFLAVRALYQQNHCDDKFFLIYPSLPLFYAMLNRRAPLDQAWISPDVGSQTSKNIIALIKRQTHWCVVIAPGFNGAAKAFTAKADGYLKKMSRKTLQVTMGSLWPLNERGDYPNALHFFIR